MPVSQKYQMSLGWPSGLVTSATSGAMAPSLPTLRMAIAGAMVMKMPANSLATSSMGPQLKEFSDRLLSERASAQIATGKVAQHMPSSSVTWKTVN
jgi:hypothetical protein